MEDVAQPIEMQLPATLHAARLGVVAVLTLARPQKRNALNLEIVEGIETFFNHLPTDVRAAVICGEGDHFSSGLDLSEVVDHGDPDPIESIAHSRVWHRAFDAIQFGRVPVVAALQGAVVGGGLELAAAAHIRVAEKCAYYALPEGRRGIFLGGGGSVRISRLVGVPVVQDLMLTGRTLSAEDGLRIGLSQYLVADGEGLRFATALADKAASNTVATNFGIIHALPRIADSDRAAGFLTESLTATLVSSGPEATIRLKDFLEKRAAKVVRDN